LANCASHNCSFMFIKSLEASIYLKDGGWSRNRQVPNFKNLKSTVPTLWDGAHP
jgi:hypothetical protein